MPILLTPAETPAVPIPGGGPRVTAFWTSPAGETLNWTDSSDGIDWMAGRAGTDMPPWEFLADDVIDGHGQVVRSVRAAPRLVPIPLIVHRDTHELWRALQQQLLRAVNPLDGDGRLLIRQPDGAGRYVLGRYESGAEGTDVSDPKGLWFRLYQLKLRISDPFAFAEEDVLLRWGAAVLAGGFFPLLPVELASSRVLGETNASNPGDVETWGIWTITGPADGDVVLRHDDLDREVVLDLSGVEALAEGDVITVDMRPLHQSIRDGAGVSKWGRRVGTPQMWPLKPGVNNITLTVTGATDATTVTFRYTPRYLSL